MSLTIRNFGRILKLLRYEKKLTQKELSDMSGVSKIQISKLENNIQKPKFLTVEKLACALNVPLQLLAEPAGYRIQNRENNFIDNSEGLSSPCLVEKIDRIINKIDNMENRITEDAPKKSFSSDKNFKNKIITCIDKVKKFPLLPDIISLEESFDIIEDIVDDWIYLPEVYNINADFVVSVKTKNMEQFRIFQDMLLFIERTDNISSGDIILLTMCDREYRRAYLKKVSIHKEHMLFLDGNGEIFNPGEDAEIIGRMVYKMDDIRPFQTNFASTMSVVKKIIFKEEDVPDEELKDKEIATWNNRGIDLSDQGKHEEAIEWFEKALALDPDDIIVLNNKAFALEHTGRNEEAIECYNKALEVNPDDELILHNKEVFMKNYDEDNNTVEGRDSKYWFNLKKDSVFDYEKIIKLYRRYSN